jgi:protein-disulfide isomerase
MNKFGCFAMAGLALVVAGCDSKDKAEAPAGGNAPAPIAAPAGQSWTETVIATPQGGFLMGNPNAPVRLVEYASLTCPHCKEFTKAATDPLKEKYVGTGLVSWEFRNFVLNPLDVAATLLTRCQGPAPFFKLTEQTYAEQDEWVARFNGAGEAELQRISTLPEAQQFPALAKAAGLDQFFRVRGLPEAKVNACLTDKAGLDAIVGLRKLGSETDKVTGTPSFLINGALQDSVFDWATLEPKLRAALG